MSGLVYKVKTRLMAHTPCTSWIPQWTPHVHNYGLLLTHKYKYMMSHTAITCSGVCSFSTTDCSECSSSVSNTR